MEIVKAIIGVLAFSFIMGGSYIWTMALAGLYEDNYMYKVGALIFVPFFNLYYVGKIFGSKVIGHLLIAISIAKLFAPCQVYLQLSGVANATIFVFLTAATIKVIKELNDSEPIPSFQY